MRKLVLATVWFLPILSVFAQETTEAIPYTPLTFGNVITSGGIITNGIGFVILALILIGLLLGIGAIIFSFKAKSKQVSFLSKLLGIGSILVFLMGLLGVVSRVMDFFSITSLLSEEAKAHATGMTVSQILYFLFFAISGSIGYILLLACSMIVFHFRQKNIIEENL